MRHGLGLNKILGTIHIYPTLAEANKYAAGEWKRAHAPQKLLEWVGRFHGWRRGSARPAAGAATRRASISAGSPTTGAAARLRPAPVRPTRARRG